MVDAWSQGAIRIQKERVGGVFGVSEKDICSDLFDLKLTAEWPKIFGLINELGTGWRDLDDAQPEQDTLPLR